MVLGGCRSFLLLVTTGILFVFLVFDFFCFYQCVYFCKKELFSKQFVSKEVKLDSICVILDKLFLEMPVL